MSSGQKNRLTDQEFHDLLKAVNSAGGDDTKSGKEHCVGQKFWRSCSVYLSSRNGGGWAPPSSAIVLPVDRAITKLMDNELAPKIVRWRHYHAQFGEAGPFSAARLTMIKFLDGADDPALQAEHAKNTSDRLGSINETIKNLTELTGTDYMVYAPRSSRRSIVRSIEGRPSDVSRSDEVVRAALASCHDAINGLIHLRHVLSAELTLDRNRKHGTGRPPDITKAAFVAMVAELWTYLTNTPAARSEDTAFGNFAHAVWSSYDATMPEVSLARAIRSHT
jgi:hypothetical protein